MKGVTAVTACKPKITKVFILSYFWNDLGTDKTFRGLCLW